MSCAVLAVRGVGAFCVSDAYAAFVYFGNPVNAEIINPKVIAIVLA